MNISLIAGLAQRLIVVCLVALILWHVTHRGPEPRGRATIYLPRENDILVIDGQSYPVEPTGKPMVCDLEAGKHRLQVKRGRWTITDEEFTINPGRGIVLTPNPPAGRADLFARSPEAHPEATNPDGLAIRTMQPRPTHN